jgi:hypothetical protein
MKELSLNILDIVENSTKAKADLVSIEINETDELLTITIRDNGVGMSEDTLLSVSDPFYTTRTTRKVGMGIPLFRLAAEQSGGNLVITSVHMDQDPTNHGTVVAASFCKTHIDFTPLGDVISTLITLIHGHPNVDFSFSHRCPLGDVSLDTREMRQVLEDTPINSFEILEWIKENLAEQYSELKK